jgi:cytochrome c5
MFSFHTVLLSLTVLAISAADAARAKDELDAAPKTHIEAVEESAATIDTSKYPAGIQANYKIFSDKCSQCHGLSRSINSDCVLPDEWSRCIGRMKHRSGSDIGSTDEKQIYDFLVYDSNVRKRDKLAVKLQALTPAAQKGVEDKIKKVADKYQ